MPSHMKPILGPILLALPVLASAYWGAYDVGNLASLDFQHRIGRIQMQIAERNSVGPASKAAAVPTARRPASTAAREFAQAYPPAQRDEAERVFAQLLQKYGELESRFEITPGDIGGALAAFVAGNLMALHQQPLPDAHFAALVHQMRRHVAANPAFLRQEAAELRRTYEQLAIVGMFMAATQTALAQKPDAALQQRTAAAARTYLATMVADPVDRLQLTAAGLVLR